MSEKNPIVGLCQKASFLISAAQVDQCPPDEGLEVAFAGRSNAGKSSALNTLTHANLARTSKPRDVPNCSISSPWTTRGAWWTCPATATRRCRSP